MVQPYNSTAVCQNDRRSCARTEEIEVRLADWDVEVGDLRIESRINLFNEGFFFRGTGMLILRRVAIQLRGADNDQTFGFEFGPKLLQDRSLRFTIRTPVRPKKKQDYFPA